MCHKINFCDISPGRLFILSLSKYIIRVDHQHGLLYYEVGSERRERKRDEKIGTARDRDKGGYSISENLIKSHHIRPRSFIYWPGNRETDCFCRSLGDKNDPCPSMYKNFFRLSTDSRSRLYYRSEATVDSLATLI